MREVHPSQLLLAVSARTRGGAVDSEAATSAASVNDARPLTGLHSLTKTSLVRIEALGNAGRPILLP